MIPSRVRRHLVGVLALAAASSIQAQTVETFAGGQAVDNQPATASPVSPGDVAALPDGGILVVNYQTHTLGLLSPSTGLFSKFPAVGWNSYPWNQAANVFLGPTGDLYAVLAGSLNHFSPITGQLEILAQMEQSGNPACSDSYGSAKFAVDSAGSVYFTDAAHHGVCKVFGFNDVRRIAGSTASGFSGDGGLASAARLNSPSGIAIDAANDIYIADTGNHRIRKIAAGSGIITTIAGTGAAAYAGENVAAATSSISYPEHVALDASGNLFTIEDGFRVRRIDKASGQLATVAGTGVQSVTSPDGGLATETPIGYISKMSVYPNGDFIFSDANNLKVRKVTRSTGVINTVIGNGRADFCGESAPPRGSCLDEPRYLARDINGDILIADTDNRRIRRYSAATGLLTTIAGRSPDSDFDFTYTGEGGPAIDAKFGAELNGIAVDAAGNIYVAGGNANRVHRIDKATGIITTIAGTGPYGFSGDGGPATSATLRYVSNVAVDSAGNVYLSSIFDHRVRKIAAGTGTISTLVGTGTAGFSGDGGPATAAMLNMPKKLGFDRAGNLLIVDSQNYRIRKIDKNTGIITTILGNGGTNSTGDGGPATAAGVNGVYSFDKDAAGNLFIISSGKVRRIDANTGIITAAAPSLPIRTPEGFLFAGPDDVAFDLDGRLYVGGYEIVARISGLALSGADSTPPVIQPTVSGTAGTNGWYVSNVQVSWTVTDAESTVSSSSGCTSSSVTSDTAGVTFTCTAASTGGTSTSSVTIKRDTVAPALTFGAHDPAPDANGWNGADVSIPFTTSDAMSGVFSTSSASPLLFTGTGAGLTRQVTVKDSAGNSATFTSPQVKIDRTPALVSPSVSGTAGANGWYVSDVYVSWMVADPESPAISGSGCTNSSVTADTAGVTFTCTATSTGGATTSSITIKRDATPPTLTFGAASPAADEAGWRAAPVTVPFQAADALSGLASTTSPSPLVITQAGTGVTSQVVVTDVAGNSATFTTPTFNVDGTAPDLTYSIDGSQSGAGHGWYRSDVRVVFHALDSEGSLVSYQGQCDSTLTTDTPGTTFTCTATSAGGSVTRSVTIKRDATPPTLSWGAASPEANAIGWHTTDVLFPYTAGDATSGIAGNSQGNDNPVRIQFTGPGVGSQITIWDMAGNQVTFFTPLVNIDRGAPGINYYVTGTPGSNGWYTGDVQVTWQILKQPENILSKTGCQNTTVTADTAGTTFSCTVASGAGTTSSSVTIKRDATPPVLNFGTPSPAPNTAGWNKTNVSIAFTRSDALSGLASTSASSPLVFSTEGANLTRQVVVTDNAGNSATFTTVPRNIDKTVPYAEIETPAEGATYGFYQDVTADFVCQDLSLVSCTSPTPQGELLNTRTAGARTFKITAKDAAGFTTNHTHSFTVESGFNFGGFLSPASPAPTLNLVSRGALVPIRWQLPDGRGGYVTNPASFTSATVTSLSCGGAASVPLNDTASGPAGISFDAASNSFVYNWQTSTSWTGCRKLTIKLKDNSLRELRFRFQ